MSNVAPHPTHDDKPQPETVVLRIEHAVMDFHRWKAAFDSDPVGRAASGVVGHRISRAADDPNYVMIDLDFQTEADATAMLGALRQLWGRIAGTLIVNPHARIAQVAESQAY